MQIQLKLWLYFLLCKLFFFWFLMTVLCNWWLLKIELFCCCFFSPCEIGRWNLVDIFMLEIAISAQLITYYFFLNSSFFIGWITFYMWMCAFGCICACNGALISRWLKKIKYNHGAKSSWLFCCCCLFASETVLRDLKPLSQHGFWLIFFFLIFQSNRVNKIMQFTINNRFWIENKTCTIKCTMATSRR